MELFWNGGNDNYNTKPTPDEKPSILWHFGLTILMTYARCRSDVNSILLIRQTQELQILPVCLVDNTVRVTVLKTFVGRIKDFSRMNTLKIIKNLSVLCYV